MDVFFPQPSHQREAAADNPSQEVEPLLDFLPQSLNGSILVTSRSQDVAYRLTDSYTSIIGVKPMDDSDALALLEKKLGSSVDKSDAVQLVHLLDCMPLAITQAAAFIKQRAPRMTVSRYVEELRRSDYDRARLLKNDVGDSRRDGRASNSIIATWQISFEHIRSNMPTAARLLSLMCLFDRQGIPESLIHDRYQLNEDSEVDFEDDIHTLTSYSLVEMSADGCKFEMHRLVQFSTKKWLELNGELEQWKEMYATLMDKIYPVAEHENWMVCQALFPHAQAAVECRPNDTRALEAWASVLFKAACYACEMGQYNIAKTMDCSALDARELVLGPGHLHTLYSLNNLALVLLYLGEYKTAEEMNRRALEGQEKVLGVHHPETLVVVNNLGLVLKCQGKYEAAEEMNRRALEGSEKILGKDHPDTLMAIYNLAVVLRYQGKYEAAEEMSRRAMEGKERVLGKDHPTTLTSIACLATVLQAQGKYEAAEKMSRRALEGREKVLGKDHPDTLASVNNLGLVLQCQGKYEVAMDMSKRALEGNEKSLGKTHPNTLKTVNNLGLVLHHQGKYKAAEEMNRRALEGSEKILGKDHPDTLMAIYNLAVVLRYQGKYEAAEEMNRRALEGREKVLGKDHPDTLTSIHCLAVVLHQKHQYEAASELYRRASSGFQHVLGPEHPRTVACVESYSSLLEEMQHDQ